MLAAEENLVAQKIGGDIEHAALAQLRLNAAQFNPIPINGCQAIEMPSAFASAQVGAIARYACGLLKSITTESSSPVILPVAALAVEAIGYSTSGCAPRRPVSIHRIRGKCSRPK